MNSNRELLLVLTGGLIVYALSHTFDLFEQAVIFVETHESWELDEFFIVTLYATFAFGLFSYRRLKEAREEIDIRKKVEKDLVKAKIEAEIANHTKGKFLVDMSHELRTPLNSVIGFSDMLLDETFGELNEKQKRYVNNILKSGSHLLNLINQLLDISKIESGKVELEVEDFEIDVLFDEVNSILEPLAKKKYIELVYHTDPEIKRVKMDRIKMKQILFNLASNAIKFTPEDGHININAKRIGSSMRISVQDSGPGIDEEGIKKIFEPFEQLDQYEDTGYKGTGLGLAIVKDLVAMHQGQVWVESENGKGATFFVEMPLLASV